MGLTIVDVSEIPGVQVGDEVVLLGKQGPEEITAAEMAGWIESIPYEVLCSIGKRVPRVYQRSEG
jgi:alanine racemase